MEESYFGNRQNPTKAPKGELEEVFKCIAEYFSYKWIKSPRTHPLQLLWNRQDSLATTELYFFGTCLRRMSLISEKWVRKQVQHIKSDQINNRIGATFEINGLGMLAGCNYELIPAKGNNPGFDGTLKIAEDKGIRLSLKSYGDSYSLREFMSYSGQVEEKLKTILKTRNISSIRVLINAVRNYPSKSDWQALLEKLTIVFEKKDSAPSNMFGIDNFWSVILGDIQDDYQEFHPEFNSYHLIIGAPFHKNEQANIFSKIDQACDNLIAKTLREDETLINGVFIHLPESASINACKNWVEQYFEQYPDKPITCVFLYQPTVSTDLSNENTFVHHCFETIIRTEAFSKWRGALNGIQFEMPIGIVSKEPSIQKIIMEVNGERKEFIFDEEYIFQRGHYYLEQRKTETGLTGNIKKYASGVFSHAVMQPFPDQPSIVLSGKFAPIDKLILI